MFEDNINKKKTYYTASNKVSETEIQERHYFFRELKENNNNLELDKNPVYSMNVRNRIKKLV